MNKKKPLRSQIGVDLSEGQRILIHTTATAHNLKMRPFMRMVLLNYCGEYLRGVAADMGSFKKKPKRK